MGLVANSPMRAPCDNVDTHTASVPGFIFQACAQKEKGTLEDLQCVCLCDQLRSPFFYSGARNPFSHRIIGRPGAVLDGSVRVRS